MGRILRVVSFVALFVVPVYSLPNVLSKMTGGHEWPMPSPFFWAAWFVLALLVTIKGAPGQELRHDHSSSKVIFALGTINMVTAFLATLFATSA